MSFALDLFTIKTGAFFTFARYVAERASAKFSPLAITMLSNFSTPSFSLSLSAIAIDVSKRVSPAILSVPLSLSFFNLSTSSASSLTFASAALLSASAFSAFAIALLSSASAFSALASAAFLAVSAFSALASATFLSASAFSAFASANFFSASAFSALVTALSFSASADASLS